MEEKSQKNPVLHGFERKAYKAGFEILYRNRQKKGWESEWFPCTFTPGWYGGDDYCVNDAYVRFRKAEKEGTDIMLYDTQVNSYVRVKMNTIPPSEMAVYELRFDYTDEAPYKGRLFPERWYRARLMQDDGSLRRGYVRGVERNLEKVIITSLFGFAENYGWDLDFSEETKKQVLSKETVFSEPTEEELSGIIESSFPEYSRAFPGDVGIFYGRSNGKEKPFISTLKTPITGNVGDAVRLQVFLSETGKYSGYFFKLNLGKNLRDEILRFERETGQEFSEFILDLKG